MKKHPLDAAIEAARAGGLDFFIVVGGDPATRLKMGLPPDVVDEHPLLLAFQAAYHSHSQPHGDAHGLHCRLSFDALYDVKIPWSTIKRLVIQNPEDDAWPSAWGDPPIQPPPPPEPPPDNVRPFRPRQESERPVVKATADDTSEGEGEGEEDAE